MQMIVRVDQAGEDQVIAQIERPRIRRRFRRNAPAGKMQRRTLDSIGQDERGVADGRPDQRLGINRAYVITRKPRLNILSYRRLRAPAPGYRWPEQRCRPPARF